MNGRVSRGTHVAEASRVLPIKRGEKSCAAIHDTDAVKAGAPCPTCGAQR